MTEKFSINERASSIRTVEEMREKVAIQRKKLEALFKPKGGIAYLEFLTLGDDPFPTDMEKEHFLTLSLAVNDELDLIEKDLTDAVQPADDLLDGTSPTPLPKRLRKKHDKYAEETIEMYHSARSRFAAATLLANRKIKGERSSN